MTGAKTSIRKGSADDLPAIYEIHRENKRWLGLLTYAAIDRHVASDQVTVAVAGSDVVGYLLFNRRVRLGDTRVVHIAVRANQRKSGVARDLIEHLSQDPHVGWRIVLNVRADWVIQNTFWANLGFVPVSEKPGRSKSGAQLLAYERHISVRPSLFDDRVSHSAGTPFSVDLNVLLDLVTDRATSELTKWSIQQLEDMDMYPVRTNSLLSELAKHPVQTERAAARAIAQSWAAAQSAASREQADLLAAAYPDVERTDINHLADAVAAGQQILLSSDTAFVQHSKGSLRSYGVRVEMPIDAVDRFRWDGRRDERSSRSEDFQVVPAGEIGLEALAHSFLSHDQGETKVSFRSELRKLLRASDTEVKCLVHLGKPVVLWSSAVDDEATWVRLLRAPIASESEPFVESVLATVRAQAVATRASGHAAAIVVDDRWVSRPAKNVLRRCAIKTEAGPGWICISMNGTLRREEINSALAEAGRESEVVRLFNAGIDDQFFNDELDVIERFLEPVVVDCPDQRIIIVPIRSGYADRLLGPSPTQLSLLGRDVRLTLRRDHVYFRPSTGHQPRPPTRILWYRSADLGKVYAMSHLAERRTGPLDEIWRQFGHLGVLSRPEFDAQSGNDGEISALRFTQTKLLDPPVDIAGICTAPPRSIQTVDARKFAEHF